MFNLKYTLILVVVLLFTNTSFAQTPYKYTVPSNVASPSPEIVGLGRLVQFPRANRTGVPKINIPLYQINDRGTSLPITLSYHARGIKVNQLASWVGMGWNLQAGGVITRSVRGLPDDVVETKVVGLKQQTQMDFIGWLDVTKPAEKIQRWPFIDEWTNGTLNEDTAATKCVREVDGTGNRIIDTEPDIFYINTPTISAKFVLDSLEVPRLLEPNQNLKIEYTTSWDGVYTLPIWYHDTIISFVVTDANGIKYTFDQMESTVAKRLNRTWDRVAWKNREIKEVDTYTQTSKMTTAWFLSKIEFINESEITFTYHEITQQMTYHLKDERGACTSNGDPCLNNGDCKNLIPLSHVSTEQTVHTKLLKEIHAPNTKISFALSGTEREDLTGGKSLESMTIYAKHNGEERPVKSFHFNYEYILSPGENGDLPITDFKRLFLTSLEENKLSSSPPPPYRFSYDENTLPNRHSKEQDFWGYYNDNDAIELIPRIYCYPEHYGDFRYRIFPLQPAQFLGNEYIFKGEDRTVNEDVITAGMLTQIKYPTCGTTDYIYEPNDYYDEGAGSNLQGGGVRIKEIIKYDGISHENDIRKIYTYKTESYPTRSSGQLVNEPVFATGTGMAWNPDNPVGFKIGTNRFISGLHDVSQNWCDEKKWNVFTRRIAESYTPLSNLDGIQVAYTHVTIHHEGIGKTRYEYFPPRTYLYNSTIVKSGVSMDYKQNYTACPTSSLHYGNIQTTGHNIFPFPPQSQDAVFTWGKLKTESNYSESGMLVLEKQYEYSNYYLDNSAPYIVYGVKYGRHFAACSYGLPLLYDHFIATWSLPRAWAKYSYQTDAVAKVSKVKTKERIVDQNSLLHSMEDSTKLFYESEHHMLLTKRQTVNSDGTIVESKFKYAPDYEVTQTDASTNNDTVLWGLHKLTALHRLTPPIEREVWEKKTGDVPRLIHAQLSTFQRIDTMVVPFKLYALETAQPLTNFTSSEMNLAKEFIADTNYERTITFDDYDDYGNLIHSIDKDGKSFSTVWGYNYSLPIANAFNAKKNTPTVPGEPGKSFGYLGFEAKNESSDTSLNDYWNFYSSNDFSSDAHTGEVSRKVTSTYGPTRHFRPENQEQQFILSAWIKIESGLTDGQLTMYSIKDSAVSPLHPNISEAYISIDFDLNNTGWQYVEAIIDLKNVRELGNIPDQDTLRLTCFPWTNDAQHYFLVDDIRFSSYHAEVSYSTYEPLVGITAESNTQDRVSYYTYTDIGQLFQRKNHKQEILQEFEYNYFCDGCVVNSPPPPPGPNDVTIYDSSITIINHSHDSILGTSTLEIGGGVPTHRAYWTVEQDSIVMQLLHEEFPVDTFIDYSSTQITHQWNFDPSILSPCDGYQVNFELRDECGTLAKVKLADYPPTITPPLLSVTGTTKNPTNMSSNVTISGGVPPYNYEWNLLRQGVAVETAAHVSNQLFDQWQPDSLLIGEPGAVQDSSQYSIFTTIRDYCHQETETEVLSPVDTIEIIRSYHDPARMVSKVNFQKGVAPYQVNWQLIENGQVVEQHQLMSPIPENRWEASSSVTQDYTIISTITDANMNQVSKTIYDSTGEWGNDLDY